MRVLLTGSRDWVDQFLIDLALDSAYVEWRKTATDTDTFIVVHGNAAGADALGRQWAVNMKGIDHRVDHESHPAQWEKYGKAAGHKRNAEMVDLGADKCIAFPLGKSPGTRGCMRLAKAAQIPVKQYQPRPGWITVSP